MGYVENFRDFKFESIAATCSTSFGNLGLFYHRFTTGDYPGFEDSRDPIVHNDQDYTAGIVFARAITGGLAGGVTLKTFEEAETVVGLSRFETVQQPMLFDFGVLYTFTSRMRSKPQLSVGISLQNLGTKLVKRTSSAFTSPTEMLVDEVVSLPCYLRTGFSFRLQITPQHEGDLTPFTVLITGAYRGLINSPVGGSQDIVWGVGGEFSIYEILSLRFGQQSQSSDDPRYGIGIMLPISRMGIGQSLTLRVDYAAIPYRSSTVKAYSIGLNYEDNLF